LITNHFEIELPRTEDVCAGLRAHRTDEAFLPIDPPRRRETISFDVHPRLARCYCRGFADSHHIPASNGFRIPAMIQ
jgi:hypothetical protein